MFGVEITEFNLLAVGIATVVSFLLGFIWYGVLFSKPWMAALGLRPEDIEHSGLSMSKAVVGSLVASFATALGLASLFLLVNPMTVAIAYSIGILVWLAFSLGPMFKLIFWEDRPVRLFAIDGGYELLSILATTSVLLYWPL